MDGGVLGYKPVPTLDPMAPEELLQLSSCNCKGDCSNDGAAARRMMSSGSKHVQIAKALHARIVLMMDSREKTQTMTPNRFDAVSAYMRKMDHYGLSDFKKISHIR